MLLGSVPTVVAPADPQDASPVVAELVWLLMPARPASLIPTVGAGVGKLAVGVVSIGPPNCPLLGAVPVGWLADWPCPKTAENTVRDC